MSKSFHTVSVVFATVLRKCCLTIAKNRVSFSFNRCACVRLVGRGGCFGWVSELATTTEADWVRKAVELSLSKTVTTENPVFNG